MLRMLLFRLWPALIPIAFYLLWLAYRKRRAAQGIETSPELLRGARFWCIVASFLFVGASFLFAGFAQSPNREGNYVPPHYENGTLIPAHNEPSAP